MPRKRSLTSKEVENLKEQRAELMGILTTGARQVSHNGKTVTFKTQTEIEQAISTIDTLLSGRPRTHIIKVYSKRGV